MIRWLADPTRRFSRRPHYSQDEIELMCEDLIASYFEVRKRPRELPLTTSTLSKILEQHAEHCDFSRDLSPFGDDVEGLTRFRQDRKPVVYISAKIRETKYSRRRRMTMAHELGHVRLHDVLFQDSPAMELFADLNESTPTYCKRSTIARGGDWMEWQASYAAGAILMPSAQLRAVLDEESARLGVVGVLQHDDVRSYLLANTVCAAFDVSGEAARVRLLQKGYIAPKHVLTFEFKP